MRVVGAGIGGLTLAIALRQRGIACTVFERQPELHEVGAVITLWANAIHVLQALGVADAVRAVSHVTSAGVIGLSNGQRIASPSLVHLSGRPSCDASLLVGADGLRSMVRRQLLGDEPLRYAGYACWRGVCAAPRQWGGTSGEFWRKGDHFGVVQIPGNRVYWFAVVDQPADQRPSLGQGAAMAIESAVVLSRVLAHTPHPPDAIALYSRLRSPRTAKITHTSRQLGALAQLSNPLLRALRNVALRNIPTQTRQRQLRELVEYDAAHVALDAGA